MLTITPRIACLHTSLHDGGSLHLVTNEGEEEIKTYKSDAIALLCYVVIYTVASTVGYGQVYSFWSSALFPIFQFPSVLTFLQDC